jgi:hypothetical protein
MEEKSSSTTAARWQPKQFYDDLERKMAAAFLERNGITRNDLILVFKTFLQLDAFHPDNHDYFEGIADYVQPDRCDSKIEGCPMCGAPILPVEAVVSGLCYQCEQGRIGNGESVDQWKKLKTEKLKEEFRRLCNRLQLDPVKAQELLNTAPEVT